MTEKVKKVVARRRVLVGICVVFIAGFTWAVLASFEKVTYTTPEVITYSTPNPEENKPESTYPWKGDAKSPKKIVYESLGIDSFIQNVGKDQNNEVAVPNNIHIAGWYVESAPIGQKGLSIIDGHVDGWTEKGIFTSLKDTNIGDLIHIYLGDGEKITYKVFEMNNVDANIAVNYLFSQSPRVTSQLNLITCGGKYNTETKSYENRIIVYAEKI